MQLRAFHLFFFFLLLVQNHVSAQGRPFIRNWGPRDYEMHNQNWCILQDPRGIMHFGNTTGLLSYDNLRWSAYSFKPDKSRATSLAWDNTHKRILVGLENGQFGFMQPGKNGALEFQSLSSKIPENERTNTPVWNILVHEGIFYFCTWSGVYVFKGEKWKVLRPEDGNTFHKFFATTSGLILREQGKGLKWIDKDSLIFIRGTECFADCKVDLIYERNPGEFLLGTRNRGLFNMALRNAEANIDELPGPASEFFIEKSLYCFTPLSGNRLACGTSSGGIAVINLQAQILDIIDKKHGLADDMVWALQQDSHGNLWAALDKGISMMEMDYPLRIFDEFHGLDGLPNAITDFNGDVITATNRGIYVLQKKGHHDFFELISEPNLDCKSISLVQSQGRSEVWVACKQGMFRVIRAGNRLVSEPLLTGVSYESVFQPYKNLPLVLGGAHGEISVFRLIGNNWEETQTLNLKSEGAIKNFCLSPKGDYLWVGEKDFGLKLIPMKKLLEGSFQSSQMTWYPFPAKESTEYPIRLLNDKVIVAPERGMMEYRPGRFAYPNGEFFPLKTQASLSGNDSVFSVFRMEISPSQKLWVATDLLAKEKTSKDIFVFSKISSNEVNEPHKPLKRLQGVQVNDLYFDNKNFLWLATNDGVFVFKADFQASSAKPFSAHVSKIRALPDSTIFFGNHFVRLGDSLNGFNYTQSLNAVPELPFSQNSLSFSFSSNQFNDAEGILYSTFMEGLEDNWTNWSKENSRDFSQLPEGNYVFRVRAKSNLLGISPETSFIFTIRAPWYRSLLAYAFYLISGIFIFRLIVNWNIRRLKALNEFLETTVKSRTLELHIEKSRVEEKNREITDSIHYAKVIQTSILPKASSITRHFDSAFILYQPRNIVSGDFYWFSQIDDKTSDGSDSQKKSLLVVADCTGHGVPGAFMSMIGNEKLIQAIRELPELSASSILSFLNVEVRKSLNQGNEESESHDGMEMALCIIDHKHHSIEFAGANRPLLIFRKDTPGEYELIKSTKSGIAGFTPDDQVFQAFNLQMKKGDRVYLYTDGLPDQFGGPNSKKLGTKGLMKMLAEIQHLGLAEQEKAVTDFLATWKNTEDQVDDILLVAFSL